MGHAEEESRRHPLKPRVFSERPCSGVPLFTPLKRCVYVFLPRGRSGAARTARVLIGRSGAGKGQDVSWASIQSAASAGRIAHERAIS
jgi:hypothetical protein